jgi:hypothetical protein
MFGTIMNFNDASPFEIDINVVILSHFDVKSFLIFTILPPRGIVVFKFVKYFGVAF